MLLGTLAAGFLGNRLAVTPEIPARGVILSGEGIITASEGVIRAGQDFQCRLIF